MASIPVLVPAPASDPLGDVPMAPSIPLSRVATTISQPGESMFRICDANVRRLDVQVAQVCARSKSERVPIKTFLHVHGVKCLYPIGTGDFLAPKNPKVWCTRHECRYTSIYVQYLDVNGNFLECSET